MAAITLQRFHADIAAAEQASTEGPVFITEGGVPKHVLMDINEYHRLNLALEQERPKIGNLAEYLAVPEDEYFEWEPERLHWNLSPVEPE